MLWYTERTGRPPPPWCWDGPTLLASHQSMPEVQAATRQPLLKLQTCLGNLQQTKQNTFLLEPHLVEKKQKDQTRLLNPEPPASTKFLHTTLHWENRKGPILPDTGSKPALEMQTNRTRCWRSSTRTIKTEILLFLNLEFFFLFFKCLSCSVFFCSPSFPVDYFGSPFFLFVFSLFFLVLLLLLL
jgi:hypothetical protein